MIQIHKISTNSFITQFFIVNLLSIIYCLSLSEYKSFQFRNVQVQLRINNKYFSHEKSVDLIENIVNKTRKKLI